MLVTLTAMATIAQTGYTRPVVATEIPRPLNRNAMVARPVLASNCVDGARRGAFTTIALPPAPVTAGAFHFGSFHARREAPPPPLDDPPAGCDTVPDGGVPCRSSTIA
jgi:hypothetical protein